MNPMVFFVYIDKLRTLKQPHPVPVGSKNKEVTGAVLGI